MDTKEKFVFRFVSESEIGNPIIHMFQLSLFEREPHVLKGQLLPSSRFFLKSPVLRLSWLKCQIFMNFSSQSKFLQTRCEILAASNEIRCVRCSGLTSYHE